MEQFLFSGPSLASAVFMEMYNRFLKYLMNAKVQEVINMILHHSLRTMNNRI